MATYVFPLHFLRSSEEVLAIAKTHKSKPFTLRRPFIPDDPRFLDTRIFGECLQEGIVGDLTSKITNEHPQMSGIPVQQSTVGPCLAATFPDYSFPFMIWIRSWIMFDLRLVFPMSRWSCNRYNAIGSLTQRGIVCATRGSSAFDTIVP